MTETERQVDLSFSVERMAREFCSDGRAEQTAKRSGVKDHAMRLKQIPSKTVKILVVDDEEPVRRFVDRALQAAGYETAVAGNGPDALVAAGKIGPFDILVTDLMMPQMNGDELARRLRYNEPELKILYLTGHSDKLFKEKATLWQDEAFLDKPCSVKALRQAVSLLLFGRFEATDETTS